jgi:uncharacterized RDD family membrane protein YckC
LNCPSCRRGLPAGVGERCPFCGALLSAPVEGALAPDPRHEPDNVEPLREIPGLRRRERTWQDEVRDRVRQRRQQKSGGDLPLFPDADHDDGSVAVADPTPRAEPYADGAEGIGSPAAETPALSELGDDPPALGPARVYDLGVPPSESPTHDDELPLRHAGERSLVSTLDPLDDDLELPPAASALAEAPPVAGAVSLPERPAQALDRAQAAAIDVGLLVGAATVVVYFASRAAHVTVAGLLPSWPYLAGYLAALGLLYATYFTGTTGQTPGKMAFSLRVVDRAGRPPGYLRALSRALVGSAGVLAAGAALATISFDPARRAVHDRLFKTRVVRS